MNSKIYTRSCACSYVCCVCVWVKINAHLCIQYLLILLRTCVPTLLIFWFLVDNLPIKHLFEEEAVHVSLHIYVCVCAVMSLCVFLALGSVFERWHMYICMQVVIYNLAYQCCKLCIQIWLNGFLNKNIQKKKYV